MKITSKTIKTLHLQRKQVDKNIHSCIIELIQCNSDESLEDLSYDLSCVAEIADLAVKGQYAKICQNGFTSFLLNSEEMELVENHFRDKHRCAECDLNLEIYDEEVFIDRVKDNQIQY
jgi:hypothetical protein